MTYTRTFSRCLYELNGSLAYQQVGKLAEAICNDSFFTYANLLFSVQTVGLAAVLIAATRYKFPSPMSQTIHFNFDGCFHLHKSRFLRKARKTALTAEEEMSLREEFDRRHWLAKVDERINLQELFECM